MRTFSKSQKLENVCYDIRGPVLDEAQRLEAQGIKILKLNIGNPAPFGLDAPEEILHDINHNLYKAEGYCDSKGILPARQAILENCRNKGIRNIGIDDIYIGNGVSEMIMISMQGLLDRGDEVLIPSPDYPLWTAATNLAGGTPVHYICDEQSAWIPDIRDIKNKITPKTKGIVIINPNNPTGALYPKEVLQQIVDIAAEHGLILFADEIYDNILYDDNRHTTLASLSDDVFFVSMNGLSKSHRIAGYRVGWMVVSGKKEIARDYIAGLNMLTSMRLCSNVPAQYSISNALNNFQSIKELTRPGGRLREQRDFAYRRINEIPGLSCTKPQGALYLFPKIDTKLFNITNDEQFIMDLLIKERILMVQGTGFNWRDPDHFRVVFLPSVEVLGAALDGLERFLSGYKQQSLGEMVG